MREMIEFSQGDAGVVLTFTATDGDGNAVDISGASITTSFKSSDGTPYTVPNGQHVVDPDQVTNPGVFTCTLTVDDTNAIPAGKGKEVVSAVTVSGNVTKYRDFIVTVHPSNPQF